MTGSTVDTHIDQVFFGWRPDGGLSPVASSYVNAEDTRRWYRRLQQRLRLQPVPGEQLPSAAFSYLCFAGGDAVFVRRVSGGVSEGRNNSVALIGAGNVLDFDAAVGLSTATWTDELPQNDQVSPVSVAKVKKTSADAQALRSLVLEFEEHVVAVLAGLIARPTAALSVIGGVERERLAIVWALHEAAVRYLPQRFLGRRDWSFSTYEDQHDTAAGDLPGIVFLPAVQPGAGTVRRLIIDLRSSRAGATEQALARQVIHYVINNLPADPSIDDAPAPPSAAWAEPGLRTGEVPMATQRPSPIPAQVPAQVPAPTPASAPAERTPVSALLDAADTLTFVQQLGLLETAQPGAAMYPHLDHGMTDQLADFIQVDIPDELMRRVLRILYGDYPERELSNSDAEKHAIKLIRRGTSDQLAGLVAAAAPALRPIRDAAFERLVYRTGRSATRSNRFPARQWRRGRRNRYFRLAAVVAALAVLGVAFLLGYLAGRPGGPTTTAIQTVASRAPTTNKAPAAPVAPAPTTAQNNQQADQNQNGGGQAVDVSTAADRDPGREVWMFRREGDGDYVVDRCDSVRHSEYSWTCRRPPGEASDHLWAISVTGRDGQQLHGVQGRKAPADDNRHALVPIP
jgi:hypothetical protein